MSHGDHYRGGAEPEEENGMGWGGLVPTAAERRAEQAEKRREVALAKLRADRDALLEALQEAFEYIPERARPVLVAKARAAIKAATGGTEWTT